MIAARGLGRRFGSRQAVEDLSFEVPDGKLCALLGPNGAGKTTTVRMLLGLIPPTSGTAEVSGIPIPATDQDGARLRGRAGLLTEAPGFYDRVSGAENLELFGRLYGLEPGSLRRAIEHWLRRLELWEVRDQVFGTWSKGMKQRLALVRAVLHEPEVIFLDEPTAGLDPAAAHEVRDMVAELRGEGRTILMCTHHLGEAQRLADLVGILRGRMIAFGPQDALTGERPRLLLRLAGRATGGGIGDGLRALPVVRECEVEDGALRILLDDIGRDTPQVVREAVRLGAEIAEVRPVTPSLEEIYLRAVGGSGTP